VLIENEFQVRAPVDHLWSYLLDVERVAPCAPGAELTEIVDDRTWKGKILMKLGPISLSFAGTVTMEERDDVAHRVVLKAAGTEQRGKGAAHANVTSWLEPGDGVTTVKMQADITLTGAVAQLSRGLLPDVTKKLTQQFAECLHASMLAQEAGEGGGAVAPLAGPSPTPLPGGPAPRPPVKAKPVGGIRLGLWAIFKSLGRFFSRLLGRKTQP
jgi:hypothetical protein